MSSTLQVSIPSALPLPSSSYPDRYYDYIPTLERDICSNFICCGTYLADLHELIEHFEGFHACLQYADGAYANCGHAGSYPTAGYAPPDAPYIGVSDAWPSVNGMIPPSNVYCGSPAVPPAHHHRHHHHPGAFAHAPLLPEADSLLLPSRSLKLCGDSASLFLPHVAVSPPLSPPMTPPGFTPPGFFAESGNVGSYGMDDGYGSGSNCSSTGLDLTCTFDGSDFSDTNSSPSQSPVTPTMTPLGLPPSSFLASPELGGPTIVAAMASARPEDSMPPTSRSRNRSGKNAPEVWNTPRRRSQGHHPQKRRDKAFKCSQPGCTKSYLNPNGLKYHVEKGTCIFEQRMEEDQG